MTIPALTRTTTGTDTQFNDMKTGREVKPKQKRLCPECGSSDVRRILYGLFAKDAKIDYTTYYPGGCCVDEDVNWHCNNCAHEWGVPDTAYLSG